MQPEQKPRTFSFWLKTDTKFGEGVSQTLPDILQEWGSQNVAVIVDRGLKQNDYAQALVNQLKSSSKQCLVVENTAAEPDYDYLDEFRTQLNASFDVIIGIGGASTLDLTKAMSVLVTNPEPAIQYRGFNLIKNPGIPMVAIPTTAGTGSEVTPNAVFTDKKQMRKLGINTDVYLPKLVLLDPLLTISCPPSVTLSSGMDALAQSIESYVAKGATPVSRMFSKEAFRGVFNNLALVLENPDNVQSRGEMQMGAYYSGIALINAGGGPAGALSYPLGVHFGVPHGLAHGTFLAPVAQLNLEKGCTSYSGLYDLIEQAEPLLGEDKKTQGFCDALTALTNKINVPTKLASFGAGASDVEMLAQQTLLLAGALDCNPVPFGLDEATHILNGML